MDRESEYGQLLEQVISAAVNMAAFGAIDHDSFICSAEDGRALVNAVNNYNAYFHRLATKYPIWDEAGQLVPALAGASSAEQHEQES